MKKILIGISVAFVAIGLTCAILFGIYVYPFMQQMKKTSTIQYDPQLTLVLGGGGNSGILLSDSAVLVIDTKMDEAATQLSNTVKKIAGNKPVIVVNTHCHTDHTSGNKYYKGQTIIAGGNYDKAFWLKDAGAETMPTVWVKDSLTLKLGDETVTILNFGWSAHTQSDLVVYLHNRKMIFTGDVVLNRQTPALFAKYNADAEGYLKAFDEMEKRFEISKVVPGHGPVGGLEVIDNFRTFFKDMKAAAMDPSKEKEYLSKYNDWGQVPVVMSPSATVKYIKNTEHL